MQRCFRLFALVMLASVAVSQTAQAQVVTDDSSCGSFCLRAPGAFVSMGLASWPDSLGIALSAGAFHNRLVGVEFGMSVPLSDDVNTDGLLASVLVGRVTVLREDLGASSDASPPTARLVLSARAGLAMIIKPSSNVMALGLAIGPAADLVLFGSLLVSVRPLVAVVPELDAPRGAAPLRPFPILEISIGAIASDSCGGGMCGW